MYGLTIVVILPVLGLKIGVVDACAYTLLS